MSFPVSACLLLPIIFINKLLYNVYLDNIAAILMPVTQIPEKNSSRLYSRIPATIEQIVMK